MKKFITIIALSIFCFVACGDTKTLCINTDPKYPYSSECYKFETYGFFDSNEYKNPNIRYELVIGNIIWSIIFCETIIVPILLLGFDMYEPIGVKHKGYIKGVQE